MKPYRRFKRKFRVLHLFLMATAIVVFWWAVWGLLDSFVPAEPSFLPYLVGLVIAFLILYLDDFHLGELE